MCCPAAKNVILAGVKTVTLHDTEAAQLPDLGSQFYLDEADIGANRASACQAQLQELNTAVAVTATAQELTDAFLATFDVRCACFLAGRNAATVAVSPRRCRLLGISCHVLPTSAKVTNIASRSLLSSRSALPPQFWCLDETT